MNQLSIRFVVSKNRPNLAGLVPCLEVSQLGEDDIAHLSKRRLEEIYGGYVFLVNDLVWNGYQTGPFVPLDLQFPTDSLVFSALFLEDLVDQIGASTTFLCAMAEMGSLRVEVVTDTNVAISAVNIEGQTIAPPTVVRLDTLLREIIFATEDGLRFGRQILGAQDESVIDSELSRQFLDRWRNASDRLKQKLTEASAGPRLDQR